MQRYCQYDDVGTGDGVCGPSRFGSGNQQLRDQSQVTWIARRSDRNAVAGVECEPRYGGSDMTGSSYGDGGWGGVRHSLKRLRSS